MNDLTKDTIEEIESKNYLKTKTPPGTKLDVKVEYFFRKIEENQIHDSQSKDSIMIKPLAPLTFACINVINDITYVEVNVATVIQFKPFLDFFGIWQGLNNQFYVSYLGEPKEQGEYIGFLSFRFQVQPGINVGDEITIFMNNIDPETSRGTITTVQPS